MGRSIESVRQGAKSAAGRWMRASRVLRTDDHTQAGYLSRMGKRRSSEGFYAFDDPLESIAFSGLVELLIDQGDREG